MWNVPLRVSCLGGKGARALIHHPLSRPVGRLFQRHPFLGTVACCTGCQAGAPGQEKVFGPQDKVLAIGIPACHGRRGRTRVWTGSGSICYCALIPSLQESTLLSQAAQRPGQEPFSGPERCFGASCCSLALSEGTLPPPGPLANLGRGCRKPGALLSLQGQNLKKKNTRVCACPPALLVAWQAVSEQMRTRKTTRVQPAPQTAGDAKEQGIQDASTPG